MSVISFPRRVSPGPTTRPLAPPTSRRAVHKERAPRRRAVVSIWRGASVERKSVLVVTVALILSLSGSMLVANRQIQLHELQSQLLQDQSTYAVRVGTLSNLSAPSQIASQAGALHLVDPVSVTQVPSTSLDVILPLPKFTGYAPVTSRTNR